MPPKEPENLRPGNVEQQPAPIAPVEIQPIVDATEILAQTPEQQVAAPVETQPSEGVSESPVATAQTVETVAQPTVSNPVENKLPAITDQEKSVYQHVEAIAETDPASAFDKIVQLRKENLAKHYGVSEETPEQKAA